MQYDDEHAAERAAWQGETRLLVDRASALGVLNPDRHRRYPASARSLTFRELYKDVLADGDDELVQSVRRLREWGAEIAPVPRPTTMGGAAVSSPAIQVAHHLLQTILEWAAAGVVGGAADRLVNRRVSRPAAPQLSRDNVAEFATTYIQQRSPSVEVERLGVAKVRQRSGHRPIGRRAWRPFWRWEFVLVDGLSNRRITVIMECEGGEDIPRLIDYGEDANG